MMQLSIFDLLESVEAEQTCERCGWGHDNPTRCSASLDAEPEKLALDTREIQIKTLENRIAIVQSKVDEIHAFANYQMLKAKYMAALDRNDSGKIKAAHGKLDAFCAELPESWIGNFERGTPSSSAFLLDGYKEDLAELKQKLAALTEPEQPARTKPTQDQLKQAILMFLGSGPGFSVSSLAMNFEREPFLFEINKDDLAKAANELCDSGRICKTPKQDGKYKIDELYWIKPGASRALNTGDPEPDGTWVTAEPDLASDFDVLFNDAEPEQAKVSLLTLAKLNYKCPFCKANADVVDSDEKMLDIVCSIERKHYAIVKKSGISWTNKKIVNGSGESGQSCSLAMFIYSSYEDRYQTISYVEAMKTAIDLRIEDLKDPEYKTVFLKKEDLLKDVELTREIFNRFPDPGYRPWVLASEINNPQMSYLLDYERIILPQLADLVEPTDPASIDAEPELILTPSHEPAVLEPRPLPKPVKVEQIGSVTPTPEQLRDAVLEILSHQPGFATTEMLRLNLNGAPWCFKVDPPVYDDSCSGDSEFKDFLNQMELAGDIQSYLGYGFGFYGKFWELPSLSTPSQPEPVSNEPRCEYCNGHMQPINGNAGQWRCLGNIYHSFYVSNGRGVWVNNSGDFDKQITALPSWAKKEG